MSSLFKCAVISNTATTDAAVDSAPHSSKVRMLPRNILEEKTSDHATHGSDSELTHLLLVLEVYWLPIENEVLAEAS